MKYVKIQNTQPVVEDIVNSVAAKLKAGKSVLLLLSGGSAIALASEVSAALKGIDLSKLHITLMDERFGPVGHADSNWQQLIEAGFKADGAHTYPVLIDESFDVTTEKFGATLEQLFMITDHVIALFGMGADGHTSGLLPGVDSIDKAVWADNYVGPDHQRITMTTWSLTQVNQALLYAVGVSKQSALDKLEQDIDIHVQPVQLLKQIADVTIYNDYKEGNI